MGAGLGEADQQSQHPGASRRQAVLGQGVFHLLGQPRQRQVVCPPLQLRVGQVGDQALDERQFAFDELVL